MKPIRPTRNRVAFAAVSVASAVVTAHVTAQHPIPRPTDPAEREARIERVSPDRNLRSYAGPACETTGFEAAEADCGWELGWICGSTFTNCTGPPLPEGCDPDPLVGDTCCIDSPNPLNGWYVADTSQHCNEPHISNENPASGDQHLRMASDPTGGDPPGCSGFSDNCRVTAFTPTTGGPLPVGPTTIEFDVAMGLPIGVPPFGFNMTYSGIADNNENPLAVYAYFQYYGLLFVYDFSQYFFAHVGYLRGSGDYDHVIIHMDPCQGTVEYRITTGGIFGEDSYTTTIDPERQARTIERAILGTSHRGLSTTQDNNHYDIDNYIVTRGEPCNFECGDGIVEIDEECDGDATPDFCVNGCVPPGEPDECTCIRTGVDCDSATPLDYGMSGPFLAHGGYFEFTADSEFTAVNTCGSSNSNPLFWNFDQQCTTYETFNPSCSPCPRCNPHHPPDPFASCYDPTCCSSGSCLCVPTVPGQTYTFRVSNSLLELDEAIQIEILRYVDCDLGPAGACCERLTGTCTDGLAQTECTGEQMIFSPNQMCDEATCVIALGACCDTTPGAGAPCTDFQTHAECQGPRLVWSKDQLCSQIACQEPTGTCCDELTGECSDDRRLSQCTCLHCLWTEAATCTHGLCEPAMGACCDRGSADPSTAICTDTLLADCDCEMCTWTKGVTCAATSCELVLGACCQPADAPLAAPECATTFEPDCDCEGCVWRPGVPCGGSACNPDFAPIPTVSTWGLAILALLLLAARKVRTIHEHAAFT